MVTVTRQAIQDRGYPKERPDPTPIHIPGNDQPLTLREEMRRFVVEQVTQAAVDNGFESFEDADDFDIADDEPDLTSAYTVQELYAEDIDAPSDELEGDEPKTSPAASEGGAAAAEPPPAEQTAETSTDVNT